MKASVLVIKVCSTGSKLIFERKIKPYKILSYRDLLIPPSLSYKDNQIFLVDDGVGANVNEHCQDLLPSQTCISAESTEAHDTTSPGFCRNNIFEFVNDKDYLTFGFHQKAEDADQLERIKLILKSRSWNLGYENNSYHKIELDQCNIVRILNDLYEESRDAALTLFFFRWSECFAGSKHNVYSTCVIIHILIAGNMNHRSVDLLYNLARRSGGEDQWRLLLEVLHKTHTERKVLGTAYSMLVDCYVKANMINIALKLIFQLKHYNFFPSLGVCNSLLGALLQSDQIELAWDFLEEIQSQGLGVDASVFSLFIHHYCCKGDLKCGWKLLTEMKKYGVNPDVVAYTILIDSLCKLRLLKEATSILLKMSQIGVTPDSVCVGSVIDGYCKMGDSKKAIDIFSIFSFPPNIYMYNSFISKFCTDGNMTAASNIFHEMIELGLRPDCYSHTTMIAGYCKMKDVNTALVFLGKMLKRGIKASVTTYTTLIDAYCKSGNVNTAENLFQNMLKVGLAPDITAYNTLMDGYGKKGQLHKAFGILDTMKSAGISPNVVTYNTIIHSLIGRGFMNEAKNVLDELIRRGFSPDVVTFTNIISGYSSKGNFEEAFLVWFYMSENHMKPDVVMCSALLNGYCRARWMDEAKALFHKMLDIGLVPDMMLYNTLVHGFCRVGSIDDACQLVDTMVKHGVLPNDVTHRALVLGYEKKWFQNPVGAAAFKVQQILLKYGIDIDTDLCSTSIHKPGD